MGNVHKIPEFSDSFTQSVLTRGILSAGQSGATLIVVMEDTDGRARFFAGPFGAVV